MRLAKQKGVSLMKIVVQSVLKSGDMMLNTVPGTQFTKKSYVLLDNSKILVR